MFESIHPQLATVKTILTSIGSVAGTALAVRTFYREFVPNHIQSRLSNRLSKLLSRLFSSELTLVIEEFDGLGSNESRLFSSELTLVIEEFDGLGSNEYYGAAEVYLGTKIPPHSHRLRIVKDEKEKHHTVTMVEGEEITDVHEGVTFRWTLMVKRTETTPLDTHSSTLKPAKSFELSFDMKYRHFAENVYLPFVVQEAKSSRHHTRAVRIFTVDYEQTFGTKNPWVSTTFDHPSALDTHSSTLKPAKSFELSSRKKYSHFAENVYLPFVVQEAKSSRHHKRTARILTVDYKQTFGTKNPWVSTTFDHPSTFETLAIDGDLKQMILMDLELFMGRKDHYRAVGKAWKRGYLLYGPPGTGKSSLIAAIANHLNFDVYDLKLTEMRRNSDLRRVLLAARSKSLLVVEDIDCTSQFQDRGLQSEKNPVTLSGFLKFIDGLWSSCGEERIIIFTTNHIDRLDPALLRPGRMDVHIHLSYCTPHGFRVLAKNRHNISDHRLFGKVEELIASVQVTLAEVAEQLLKNNDVDLALGGLLNFLEASRERVNSKEILRS